MIEPTSESAQEGKAPPTSASASATTSTSDTVTEEKKLNEGVVQDGVGKEAPAQVQGGDGCSGEAGGDKGFDGAHAQEVHSAAGSTRPEAQALESKGLAGGKGDRKAAKGGKGNGSPPLAPRKATKGGKGKGGAPPPLPPKK